MQRIKCLLSHRFEFHYILVERISNLHRVFIRWIFIFGCSYFIYITKMKMRIFWSTETVRKVLAYNFMMAFFIFFFIDEHDLFGLCTVVCYSFWFCKIMLLNPRCAIPCFFYIISDHLHTIPTSLSWERDKNRFNLKSIFTSKCEFDHFSAAFIINVDDYYSIQ